MRVEPLIIRNRRPIAISHGVFVPVGQEMRGNVQFRVRAGLGIEPVLLAVNDPALEHFAGKSDAVENVPGRTKCQVGRRT